MVYAIGDSERTVAFGGMTGACQPGGPSTLSTDSIFSAHTSADDDAPRYGTALRGPAGSDTVFRSAFPVRVRIGRRPLSTESLLGENYER